MASLFLESNKIKVYPTSYRKVEVNDVNSGILSEKNLIYLKKLSQYTQLNSYFECTKDTSGSITTYNFDLTLYGYRFIFDLTSTQLESFSSAVFACIKLNSIEFATDESTYLLSPQNGNENSTDRILDVGDGTPNFLGLSLAEGSDIPSGNNVYTIQLLYKDNKTWEVCPNKNLKIASNEIMNGATFNENIKNITEQFDGTNLNITATATINNLNVTNATIALATITNTLDVKNGTVTVLNAGNNGVNVPNINVTNLATINKASVTNATVATATINKAIITNASVTTETVTDLKVTNATITNATITNEIVTNSTVTNANITTATISSIDLTGEMTKDGVSRVIPDYTDKTNYSVLAVVNNTLTWIPPYDGSFTN